MCDMIYSCIKQTVECEMSLWRCDSFQRCLPFPLSVKVSVSFQSTCRLQTTNLCLQNETQTSLAWEDLGWGGIMDNFSFHQKESEKTNFSHEDVSYFLNSGTDSVLYCNCFWINLLFVVDRLSMPVCINFKFLFCEKHDLLAVLHTHKWTWLFSQEDERSTVPILLFSNVYHEHITS